MDDNSRNVETEDRSDGQSTSVESVNISEAPIVEVQVEHSLTQEETTNEAPKAPLFSFKKTKMKSASLNKTFLNKTVSAVPSFVSRPSLKPTLSQSSERSKVLGSSTLNMPSNIPPSIGKLKLTTMRAGGMSELRMSRENSSSPQLAEGNSNSTSGATPVWGRNMAPQKAVKDYTDEELKAMHGIHLASRISADDPTNKDGRWDDVKPLPVPVRANSIDGRR